MMKGKNDKSIRGFSRLSKREKLNWVCENFFGDSESARETFEMFHLSDPDVQNIFDGFSENTISNHILPYGVAPNFLINNKTYCIPMVIEESSVVAAASSAAKFWAQRGGFHYEIKDMEKIGQIHFFWSGDAASLKQLFKSDLKNDLNQHIKPFIRNMEKRGGGVREIKLTDKTTELDDYYQLVLTFDTCDSMGANFINTILEECLKRLKWLFANREDLKNGAQPEFLMAILSNYTPNCLATAWVECSVDSLHHPQSSLTAAEFADRFHKAVKIAQLDKYRAVTHNKGVFNGLDAVVLATGNDFRAVESCGHAFASRSGRYQSLTDCSMENGIFRFSLDIPLAIGTVGGLTCLHPLAKSSLEMLGNPSARELMGIAACTGLAQNFAAIRSLITTGIQYGHMKMHLENILNHLNASPQESEKAALYFESQTISFNSVRNFLENIRCTRPVK